MSGKLVQLHPGHLEKSPVVIYWPSAQQDALVGPRMAAIVQQDVARQFWVVLSNSAGGIRKDPIFPAPDLTEIPRRIQCRAVRASVGFSKLTLVLVVEWAGAGQGSEDKQRPRGLPATPIRYREHHLGAGVEERGWEIEVELTKESGFRSQII